VIACHWVWIVGMAWRVNGGIWVASLDRHRHGPGVPSRWAAAMSSAGQGAELWVARHEARLREDVDKIRAWQEKVRGNRLAKADQDPPFGWIG
jgi:hypothetical protein